MIDPEAALEATLWAFSKLGSLGGSLREWFSRMRQTKPALTRPAFSWRLLVNDRFQEKDHQNLLNVLYFPNSEATP
jgi:hypothetical protein